MVKNYGAPRVPMRRGGTFLNDAAIGSGLVSLVSELEKIEPSLREPLLSVNYPRDITVDVGGGWAETESQTNVDYGVAGGSGENAFAGGASSAIRRIQADLSKDVYATHLYEISMSMKFVDVQRSGMIGRSLESIYDSGIRLDFDNHMEINTYRGYGIYGTTGLINDPKVVTSFVPNGAGGNSAWVTKTPDEILKDVNDAITAAWAASEYDNSAIPNHILIDAFNYAKLVSAKVGVTGDKSILSYLLENNIAKEKGVDLVIAECRFCKGAGVGGTNRMLVYRHEKRFVRESLLQPLQRIMTQANTATHTYDSAYAANIGTVIFGYYEPVRYYDGI